MIATTKTRPIYARLATADQKTLRSIARRDGTSPAAVARRFIEAGLERHRKQEQRKRSSKNGEGS